MRWYVRVITERGVVPSDDLPTKREALKHIASLGEVAFISRTTVPGGRAYTVSLKKT